MKVSTLVSLCTLSILAALPALSQETHCARCTGSATCRACTNCSRCAHCNSGGSCGVCAGTSLGRGSSSSGRSSGSSSGSWTPPATPRITRPRPTPTPPPAPLPNQFTAKVVGITDGDTLVVLTASKRQVKIRLHGVDAPETAQPFGQKSKQSLSDYCYGRLAEIQRQTVDKYGRLVAVVTPHGASTSANARQLIEGMAWWYRQYSAGNARFEALEKEARATKRGLWSEPNPTPPWEWRHQ